MTSSRFSSIPPAHLSEEQRRLIERAGAGPRQRLGAPLSVLLHSVGVADPLEQLSEYVRYRSAIPKRLKEFMILIVARHWTAHYPWSRHYASAIEAGISPSAAAQIASGERPAELRPDEADIYDFCSALVAGKGISDLTYSSLKAAYGESGIVDLIGLISYYCAICMALVVDQRPAADGDFPALKPIVVRTANMQTT